MKNQAIPEYKANEIILRYASGIEADIDEVLGSVLENEDYDERTIRITQFLNAVLCNGGVVPPAPKDELVCHHTPDEWVFTPCGYCPKNQREATDRGLT